MSLLTFFLLTVFFASLGSLVVWSKHRYEPREMPKHSQFQHLTHELLLRISGDPNLVAIASGETKLASDFALNTEPYFPHYPAFVPIRGFNGDTFFGYWLQMKDGRFIHSVCYHPLEWVDFREIARTDDQLYTYIVSESCDVWSEEEVASTEKWLKQAGRERLLPDIVGVCKELNWEGPLGYDHFHLLKVFQSDTPRAYLALGQTYDGELPTPTSCPDARYIHNLELADDIFSDVQISAIKAMRDGSDKTFEDYLNCGDIDAAWVALNMQNFKFHDETSALKAMCDVVDDDLMNLIYERWKVMPQPWW